ncbi:hypothetical protein TCAL_15527 [Tigriopus californicus]|uniref:Uncharacterized protein n=1 Tax=Tigriopus californicus TaxID=6832 RepID=A0A553PTL2_TIGCA|nr:hypothetical protein TCAL_15527 [Tigriopus californicus]
MASALNHDSPEVATPCEDQETSLSGLNSMPCSSSSLSPPNLGSDHSVQRMGIGNENPCSADHEHQPVHLQFDSMAEALNWRVENQLDRYFSFKSCKSTKGLPGSYRVMNCNRKAKDITNDAKKSKKTFQCLAKVIFNQREVCCCHDHQSKKCSNAKLQVMVYGCLAHSHSLERRNIRLSKKVKDQAVELLTSGIRSDVVIEKYLSTNDQDLHSKPVTYRDVYRIKKTCNLGGYDEKASEVKNVMNLLGDVAFHGFNFGKQFTMSSTIPEEIQEKVAETSGYFLLTYASPEMLKRFRDHSTIISIDGTHGTNSAKFVLISVLVFGSAHIYSECNKAKKRIKSITSVLKSDDYDLKEKRRLMDASKSTREFN